MQFQQDWPKDKKMKALLIFWRKTEKFRSNEIYGAVIERSTFFFITAPHAVRQRKAID